MLVTFTSSTSGEIMMFSEIAHYLFEIIGKQGTARGVFTHEQLPDAIEKLQQAINAEKGGALARPLPVDKTSEAEEKAEEKSEESQGTPAISLAQRAHPFITLMELTRNEKGFVMWQAAQDF